ncbi:MAG: formylglycine-generating enzyme family protein [Motilibacteraceae bacterium]
MTGERACCAPSRGDRDGGPVEQAVDPGRPAVGGRHALAQISVPGGRFLMGDAHGDGAHGDGETPVHPVVLSAFSIDATSVTNADFARFVEDTGYRTEAETFGYSAVFHLALRADEDDVTGPAAGAPWWLGVRGADWRHPGGRRSDLDGLADHPVVHVSWNDAQAYCRWAGRALPSEAQWEHASRGGLAGARYPWGDEVPGDDEETWPCNIWQGTFPVSNTMKDGFLTTAPVRSFEPNGFGLWQTVGNVWEWCADWFNPRTYELDLRRGEVQDPVGPAYGLGRVMRGGSYLCHDSYCNRYRNAARTSNTPDSSSGNVGFRTVGRA